MYDLMNFFRLQNLMYLDNLKTRSLIKMFFFFHWNLIWPLIVLGFFIFPCIWILDNVFKNTKIFSDSSNCVSLIILLLFIPILRYAHSCPE